jgi:arylsulfatase A-like enzyme
MSDNGGLSLDYARGGQSHTHNLPLKAGKGSIYEGGIRVPMIVKWPNIAKAGSVIDEPVIIEDFFPSILEMAGIEKKELVQQVDGKGFLPLLKGQNYLHKNRFLVWHNPHQWTSPDGPGINYFSAIRQGKWKLIYDYRKGKLELYDLYKDLGEQVNLAEKEKKAAKKLSQELTRQLKGWKTVMPTFKATGKSVLWTDEVL